MVPNYISGKVENTIIVQIFEPFLRLELDQTKHFNGKTNVNTQQALRFCCGSLSKVAFKCTWFQIASLLTYLSTSRKYHTCALYYPSKSGQFKTTIYQLWAGLFSTLCKRLVKSYSKCCLRLLSHNNFHIYYLLMFIFIDCICLSFLWNQTKCSKILQEEDDGRAKKKLPKCFCYPDHFLWWNAICLTTYVLPNCKSPMASRLVLEAGKSVFYCETLL